ncbi:MULTISPECIES: DUF397 domain-containing protein [unclassified Streptomyces]|uniref:DUF397 domain-containing protein n=1 Tax=unclassified Streptomyces TaxID=2593676 RepID=UPI003803351C
MRKPSAGEASELVWFKSTYSSGNDGESCVELALEWFKSTYSGGNDGESCVECAVGPSTVYVRDSKWIDGARLVVSPGAWGGFLGFAAER